MRSMLLKHHTGFIPSRMLESEAGSWEAISQIIEYQLLPTLDQVGAALFLPKGDPVPSNVYSAPIENQPPMWYRKCPQIVYIVQGEEQIVYRGQLYTLRARQGVILFKSGGPHISHIVTSKTIPFRDCLWFDFLPSGCVVHRCQLSFKEHLSGPHYMLLDPKLQEIFQELEEELNCSSRSNPLIVKSLLMSLFSLLVRAKLLPLKAVVYPLKESEKLPLPLRKAIQIMHRSYNRPFSLTRLAQVCGFSPFHFCRVFKNYLGTTPLRYLTQLRLEIARRLLETSSLSITEIAHLVGYSNPAYLTRLFCRFFNIPPTKVRPQPRPSHHPEPTQK
ncbi:HTH-type transcriptional activator Btr [bacterium HR17]|uniref:HTH-type transcriptional activator Btr n=1 Tax=Candidatus Fervidibacter japonicus TaxID=2035412 RepID=A0A2H5XF85_9BACT|nr:HTH-type transcriptional activator Btr [bacterium HR17]